MSDALLPTITLSAHPSLSLPRPFRLFIPASPTLLQHSVTITLPSTHDYLQIVPHVPVALASPPRPYRLFVTVNGVRLIEVAKPSAVGTTSASNSTPLNQNPPPAGGVAPVAPVAPVPADSGKEKGRPRFEGRLVPGVNRLEVEIVAATAGAEKSKDVTTAGGTAGAQQNGQGQGGQPAKKERDVEWEKCTIFVNLMRG